MEMGRLHGESSAGVKDRAGFRAVPAQNCASPGADVGRYVHPGPTAIPSGAVLRRLHCLAICAKLRFRHGGR